MQKTFSALFALSLVTLSFATPIAVPQPPPQGPWRSYGDGAVLGNVIAEDPNGAGKCRQFCNGHPQANILGIDRQQGMQKCVCLQYAADANPTILFSIHSRIPGYKHHPLPPSQDPLIPVKEYGHPSTSAEGTPAPVWKRVTRFPFLGVSIKNETMTGQYNIMMSGCIDLCKKTPYANILMLSPEANGQLCICFNSREGAELQRPISGTAMYVLEGAQIARETGTGGGPAKDKKTNPL